MLALHASPQSLRLPAVKRLACAVTYFNSNISSSTTSTLSDDIMYYRNLRIFKNTKSCDLINLFMINKMLHYACFVNNAHTLYKLSTKVLGKQTAIPIIQTWDANQLSIHIGQSITETIIKRTMGKVFTGGSSISEIQAKSNQLKLNSKYITKFVYLSCVHILFYRSPLHSSTFLG